MSSSKKDYNMCLYNSLSSKAGDSPKNIKKNIASEERRKIGKLGDTIDLNNFVEKYPFDVIVIRRRDDNKPDFSQIYDYFKTSGQAKDTIVIMHSKNHFEPVNSIPDDIMEVLKFLVEDFENRRLQTSFINNTYESEMEQAMKNSLGGYHDEYELEMIQAMENSLKIEPTEKEDTSLDSALALSLFEHEQFIQTTEKEDTSLDSALDQSIFEL